MPSSRVLHFFARSKKFGSIINFTVLLACLTDIVLKQKLEGPCHERIAGKSTADDFSSKIFVLSRQMLSMM